MSDIVEILGEKKIAGSSQTDLSTRIMFSSPNKIRYEYNLFMDVNQQDQYDFEKQNCSKIRIYGKINPIINFDVYRNTIIDNSKVNIRKDIFDMNTDNWSIVILQPKRIPTTSITSNNEIIYQKGNKLITNISDGTIEDKLTLNFIKGLPARLYYSPTVESSFVLYFPFGHNFVEGDRAYVEGVNKKDWENKIYDILNVVGDKVYINAPAYIMHVNTSTAPSTKNNTTDLNKIVDYKIEKTATDIKNNQILINGLIYEENPSPNFSRTRSRQKLINNPEFYVSKVIEKEKLEYYIKTLEVIGIIDDFSDSAFSINNFEQKIKNFIFDEDLEITGLVNNKGIPLTDIYIGIIKIGTKDNTIFSNTESYFENYINKLAENDGLEKITDNKNKPSRRIAVGDVFYHSLCENTTEALTEVEITKIQHRFLHKDIIFSYQPFYKVKIKHESPYIEDSDTTYSIPDYAIYSKQSEKFIWRDIFDVGIMDENGNGVDLPFMNGSFYVYSDINFFVKTESWNTKKYMLNQNDITNGNQLMENNKDNGLDNANAEETKPYAKYTQTKC